MNPQEINERVTELGSRGKVDTEFVVVLGRQVQGRAGMSPTLRTPRK